MELEGYYVLLDPPSCTPCHITNLPPELLELIFRKLTFDNVAKIRPVCHHFNTIASSLLNSEFSRLRMNMLHRFHSIKAQMPRRESARRKHPLARESDIIETLHMRLTLLHMTFGKHIERKHCCFFAGEILDEVYRILNYVKSTPSLNRAYKVTDELFDLSTMAMEYFKEHIEPSLPEITYFAADFLEYTPTITCACFKSEEEPSSDSQVEVSKPFLSAQQMLKEIDNLMFPSESSPKTQVSLLEESVVCAPSITSKQLPVLDSVPSSHATTVNQSMVKKLRKLREHIKKNNGHIVSIKQELKLAKKKILSQQKQINEFKSVGRDYNRKFQNASRKLTAIMQELNQFKTEFQYWRSKSPAASCACGTVTPVLELRHTNHSLDTGLETAPSKSEWFSMDDFKPIDPDDPIPLPMTPSSCLSVTSSSNNVISSCHSVTSSSYNVASSVCNVTSLCCDVLPSCTSASSHSGASLSISHNISSPSSNTTPTSHKAESSATSCSKTSPSKDNGTRNYYKAAKRKSVPSECTETLSKKIQLTSLFNHYYSFTTDNEYAKLRDEMILNITKDL